MRLWVSHVHWHTRRAHTIHQMGNTISLPRIRLSAKYTRVSYELCKLLNTDRNNTHRIQEHIRSIENKNTFFWFSQFVAFNISDKLRTKITRQSHQPRIFREKNDMKTVFAFYFFFIFVYRTRFCVQFLWRSFWRFNVRQCAIRSRLQVRVCTVHARNE